MNLLEILRNVPWRPGIGDPSFAGWLTVILYFITAAQSFAYWQRLESSDYSRRDRPLWFLLGLTLVFLGFNKQLDLQSLLTDIGREISKNQGWYGGRRAVQLTFIAFLAALGGGLILTLGWVWRRSIRQHLLIFLGLAALLFFVIIRAVSFHTVDLIIQQRLLGVRLNTILEMGSLLMIGWGLWRPISNFPNRRPLTRPLFLLTAALATAAVFFQLLSGSQFDWKSDFDNVGLPYQHPGPTVSIARPVAFLESFDHFPSTPMPFADSQWDTTVHTRDWSATEHLEPLEALYGANCAPPPATHVPTTFAQALFVCDGRLVSAINGSDYAATVIAPAYLLDFQDGPATLTFSMSTQRTSGRDWIEIWISPFDQQLQLPGQDWMPDMNGHPNNGVQLFLDLGSWRFSGKLIRDGQVTDLEGTWFELDQLINPSTTELTTFELQIDPHQVVFGVPEADQWWVDASWDESLSWSQGVVQISHHSFEPTKDCGQSCAPNSWVFDDIALDPAVPFTLISATQAYVNRGTGPAVTLSEPTPEGANLRFVAFSEAVQVSFDQGKTWQPALRQEYVRDDIGYQSFWTPIPPAVDIIHFRARDFAGNDWQIRDISVWSLVVN